MRTRRVFILLVLLLFSRRASAFAAAGIDLQIKATTPGSVVGVEQLMDDDKVMVSVNDEGNNPLLGLTSKDFVITSGTRKANIISAQPVSETLDVPRNFILVLDNSLSMYQRRAVQPLLAGVSELLKIVRPIDRLEVVVFSEKGVVESGGRELHVRTFSSDQPVDIMKFVSDAYNKTMTSTTVLYEAVLAGFDLMRTMPEKEPRFLVVFSDGEDINSAYGAQSVLQATEGLGRFHAYAIDYMPGPNINSFLTAFTEANDGETWKATSETNLVPIFQSVASKIQYYYVLNFLFPPTGILAVSPAFLTIDEVENFDASKQGDATPVENLIRRRIDTPFLTMRPTVDTAYGLASWKLTVANSAGILSTESGKGTLATEIYLPIKADDLKAFATGGDVEATLEATDNKGQSLELTSQPVKVSLLRTTGSLTVSPSTLTIEEIKTIDSSPMLGYIYFAEGSGFIPPQYVRLSGPGETASFNETSFKDTLEKYYQVLNIIGKRLRNHPEANIILTGCNASAGSEKRNTKLSKVRANEVRDYLQAVWTIAPERVQIEMRNLPEKPSNSSTEEGRAENRRVEIHSDVQEILAPIRSTYLATRIDSDMLTLQPTVEAAHQIATWTVMAENANGIIRSDSGQGKPPAEIQVVLGKDKLNELAAAGDITPRMALKDSEGQELIMVAAPVTVNFIQTSQRLAQKQDYKIQEKYALILFDFNSDAISAGNEDIIARIAFRLQEIPGSTAEIVGHTDTIGKEDYNIKLSQRRALAVYNLLTSAIGEDAAGRVSYRGVGPNEPLYDNSTPEARAFNRTVTITLEYTTNE